MNKAGRKSGGNRWVGITAEARLRAKVDEGVSPGSCWIWRGAVNSGGYGSIWLNGKVTPAHRAAYIIFRGEIPAGLQIDHLCRDRRCCNPDHLEAVTARENLDATICALCGKAIDDDTAEKASDGNPIHGPCSEEYEDIVYHREFEA